MHYQQPTIPMLQLEDLVFLRCCLQHDTSTDKQCILFVPRFVFSRTSSTKITALGGSGGKLMYLVKSESNRSESKEKLELFDLAKFCCIDDWLTLPSDGETNC